MNKKIIMATLAVATAGITIYLVSQMIAKNQKKSLLRKADKLRAAKQGRTYAYEYTL